MRGMKKRSNQADGMNPIHVGYHPNTATERMLCVGCGAKDSIIEFLKHQNQTLQEKLLALVPPAMDSYMRLQMSQQAQLRPETARGIQPESMAVDDDGLDQFFNDVTNMSGVPGRGRPV